MVDQVAIEATAITESAMHGVSCRDTQLKIRAPACLLCLFVITAIFMPPRRLTAGSASASLSVTATVLRTCRLSTSSVTLGNYDPSVRNATPNHRTSAELTVVCNRGSTSAVTVGAASNAPGTINFRLMFSEGNKLRYEPYKRSGLFQIGSSSASDLLLGTTNEIAQQPNSVHGPVPPGQLVGDDGGHLDTVTYTINF